MAENKEDDDLLIRDSTPSNLIENSNSVCGKPSSSKCKIIMIISVSFIALAVIAALILIFVLKDDSNKNKDEEEIEVLPPIIIEPVSDYTHCIIWLHGLDAMADKFYNLFTKEVPFAKRNNTKIILMQAPYQILSYDKHNGTSWFDLFSFPIDDDNCYNFTDATRSKKMVEKIIHEEAKKLNGKYQNIFIGGHSQGACISLYTAYNFKELLGGVLVCSGVLFKQVNIEGDKNKLNVFLAHGSGDKAIPFAYHNETVERIKNFEGVKTYYYEGAGHDIYPYEKNDMGKFLNETMI